MQLNRNWSDFLVNRPEKGMGYQIVDITLQDGSIHKGVIVFNCEQVRMSNISKPFTVDEIADMYVH